MRSSPRWTVIALLVGDLLAASAAPAFAIYPQLQTTLTGAPIDGVVPEGDAEVDQSKLPAEPARLEARVKNMDPPDGTVLDVVLTDCGAAPVGRMTLSRGEGCLATTLGSCQVSRTSSISIVHAGVRILAGGSPWQV